MSNACKLLKILSFFFFVVGILSAGMRAANNPAKAGVVWIWSIVCLACSVISLLLSLPLLGGTGSSIPDFTGLIVSIIYFVLANRVKKEGMDRLS